jgi:hypothetical protein
MTLFKSEVAQDIWLDHYCHRCYRDNDCSIKAKALSSGRKPREWDRNSRSTLMQDAYKCNEFRRTPPRSKQSKHFEDVPMFDVGDMGIEEGEVKMVPVKGWPDRPRKGETDHA